MGRYLTRLVGTLFETKEHFESLLEQHVSYAVYQTERAPTTGTVHLQCYVELQKPQTIPAVGRLFGRGHWEPAKAPLKAIEYCRKLETREEGPWEYGVRKGNNKGTWTEALKHLSIVEFKQQYTAIWCRYRHAVEHYITEREPERTTNLLRGIYLWGPPGSGKTRACSAYKPYVKAPNKWWCGYEGQEVVLADDWPGDALRYLAYYVKIWTDHYEQRGEIKGGNVKLRHCVFIITHNASFDEFRQHAPTDSAAIARRFVAIDTREERWEEHLDREMKARLHPTTSMDILT